ncbi:unnamed protein product [Rotaria sp. Silwood1]|nr:unnamed protein product [Rotaria sp. Silwood1]CAF3342073.1 unnamed protein product [Rotaria sp. Silwood1]CAF3346184.1 unnamed protein product [Rotaria sp. Silwood1]CAF4586175.1 unnamed protein product [Rotaria sp. Silwood1]CAF4594918.1 unnamed protein product [Rotaria sp. Silwood1]
MMAAQISPFGEAEENNSPYVNASSTKKSRSTKRNLRSVNSNGIMENGNGLLLDSIPSRPSKRSENQPINESNLETSTNLQSTVRNSNLNNHQLHLTLTPVESSQSNATNIDDTSKFRQIELNAVSDEDEDGSKQDKKVVHTTDYRIPDHDPIITSYTSASESDIIEIHEFSSADVDAYLDIYFEMLHNRLLHFIGDNDQLQEFRMKMKNRINSDTNSREYQNVLLGKMYGEVVAAVTLSFPGETTTVPNDNILPQENSCLASIRRWMIRNANYIPTAINECYIEMIGVKSSHRNQGIGAALLECVEHFAQEAGAQLLTVHTNGEQLANYFERFGFMVDHSDNSAFWKWVVERQKINKMAKVIIPHNENYDDHMDNGSSYINESMDGIDHV